MSDSSNYPPQRPLPPRNGSNDPRTGGPRGRQAHPYAERPQAYKSTQAQAHQARRRQNAVRAGAYQEYNQAYTQNAGVKRYSPAQRNGQAPRPASRRPQPSRPLTKAEKKRLNKARKAKRSPKQKALLIILDLLIVLIFASALYFFLKPIIVNFQQVSLRNDILDQLKNNKGVASVEIDKKFAKVHGEALEPFNSATPQKFVEPDYEKNPRVQLKYFATLFIPSIQVRTPLADNASPYTLRFGVGILPWKDNLTQKGITYIFGHRFQTKGRDFNRIGEIKSGDIISIADNVAQKRYDFVVTHRKIIEVAQLYGIVSSNEIPPAKTICLVSCHPEVYDPNLPQRILVYAQLKKVTDIQK